MGRRVLALIRHGEYAQPEGVPSAHLLYGLTERGKAQARAAATAVAEFARQSGLVLHSIVDCSSLRRAWETAQLLCQGLQPLPARAPECREFDALAERSVGAAANLSILAIEAILRDDPRYQAPPPGWKRDAEYRLPFPGCESLNQAGARVARHLREAAAGLDGSGPSSALKLLVGHGGAFRHAACELGVLTHAEVAQLSMGYGDPVYLEAERTSTGVDRFVHIAGRWRQRGDTTPVD